MSPVRRATPSDSAAVSHLLHAFNTEFDDVTPGVEVLTERIGAALESGEITAFLAGEDPDGFAIVRHWTSLVTVGLEGYLAELYVVPDLRGQGIGRALLRAVIDDSRDRGATYLFLGTSDDDHAARGLYESEGFTNREGKPDGPIMYVYEREL